LTAELAPTVAPADAAAAEAASDLDLWVARKRGDLEQLFDAHLPNDPDGGDPGRLVEAMRYSLLAPGKRLRPLLALAAAEALGRDGEPPVLLACAAVELVHCYSLVHDDLPPMDDDDFRRGQPSNHKAFGEATAILAGDALLTLAFEWLAEAGAEARRPADFLRAVTALARGAGMAGMVRGQARDLGEPPPATLDGLERREDRGPVPRRPRGGCRGGGRRPADGGRPGALRRAVRRGVPARRRPGRRGPPRARRRRARAPARAGRRGGARPRAPG
jgi:hypothetical protein